MRSLLVIVVFVVLRNQQAYGTTCIGDHGKEVDMFVIYKLPRMRTKTHNSRSSNIQSGYRYAYLDAATNYRFIHSEYSINDKRGALGRTLNQIYENRKIKRSNEDLAHLFYND